MHFFVLKENLQKALSIVTRNISARPQLPILANVVLETEDNQLKISATNLELGVVYKIGAKVEKQGKTAVPGKLLAEYISNLNAEKIEIILEEKKLQIKTDKTLASFSSVDPTDYPLFADIIQTQDSLSVEKIKDSILRTVFAASTDETRPVLTGVKILITKNNIQLVATDGYRLSKEEIETKEAKKDFQVIIPAHSLIEIVRIAAELKESTVGFSILEKKNQLVFTMPNIQIFTRLIEGEFPNIEKIIPSDFKTKAVIEKDKFIQAVKTTSLFARGAANIIKIKIQKDGLWLSANTPQIGENKDFIEAKTEGESVDIAFNYRFLLDLLNNFPDKEIIFETQGPLNPGVFKPTSKKLNFLHLIMPVRVQE